MSAFRCRLFGVVSASVSLSGLQRFLKNDVMVDMMCAFSIETTGA